jgi:hypothetical protein
MNRFSIPLFAAILFFAVPGYGQPADLIKPILNNSAGNYDAITISAGSLQVRSQYAATIALVAALPSSALVSSETVRSITYILNFDPKVATLSKNQLLSAITAPRGWRLQHASLGDGELTIQFSNDGSGQLTEPFELGTLEFFAGSAGRTDIKIAALQVITDHRNIGLSFDAEDDQVARFVVETESVAPTNAPQSLVTIYPNPVGSAKSIRLGFNTTSATETEISLSDMLGREVYRSQQGSLSVGEHSVDIPVAGITKGSYSLRVVRGSLSEMRKIVIE